MWMRVAILLPFLGILAPSAVPGQEPVELVPVAELEAQASREELARLEAEFREALAAVVEAREDLEGDTGPSDRFREDDVRIVNGVLTWAFPSTGAVLHGASRGSAGSHCTGTLIGCRTFLTANHCVERDRDPGHYFVYLQQGGIFAVEEISEEHPDYDFPHADYAILRLAENVQGIPVTPINAAVVAAGTRGTIVGFGRSGGFNEDYGLKRAGRVTTATCDRPETSLLCWDFQAPVGLTGEDSNTCNADSGGPLFVDTPAGPVVVGITSGGSRSTCLEGDHSYDVDVRQFLAQVQAFAGDDLGATNCSDLPLVGQPDVQVFGDSRNLGGASALDYRVQLPAGISLLRFALNGQDEFTTDFDLLVNEAGPAEPGTSVCEENGSSNYAFCELASPREGDWFVRVRQKGSGSGTYQLIATIVRETP